MAPSLVFPAALGRDLLSDLDPAQRDAVTSPAETLCILAGAGSGKTRVLTRRIAWRVGEGSASASKVLALTFTRRAAAELGTRLAGLGLRERVAAGTFHGVAYAQLRRRWAEQGRTAPTVLDRKVRLLASLLPARRQSPVQPADVAAEIEWAKARMVRPSEYVQAAAEAGRRPPLPAAAVAEIFHRYERLKDKRGLLDFDDLLGQCASAVESDPVFAASQRWRFRHLFVDEFQDVNPLQHRLLEAWRGQRPDLCVVGDPNQAIYSWNGADAGYLARFSRSLPGAQVVHLDRNYRSSSPVVAVANAVLQSQSATARPLRACRDDGSVPTVRRYRNEADEARAVAGAIRRRAGASGGWARMAVLARTHAQLLVLEQAFGSAGIPYRLRGSVPFLARPEVSEALAAMAAGSAPSLSAAVVDLELPAEVDEADERTASLAELVRLAREHLAADPDASVAAFVGWLRATLTGEDASPRSDAVELCTFHAAKGLEWPVVFLVGLEQGLVPVARAETPEARAEEQRLLYVAVTRAQDELHCSWAERRTFGPRALPRSPSPYLEAVNAAVADLGSGGTGADWRRFLEQSRESLAATQQRSGRSGVQVGRNADPTVLEALRSWRASTAKASGVPAFVVFHDTTLAAVAEARPTSRSGLLALPGLGPVKVARYGDAILQVVAAAG